MPFTYTPDEYIDMLLIYGECRRNARDAAQLYQERFPDRDLPSHVTFYNIEKKMRTGAFPSLKRAHRQTPARSDENVISVLAYAAVNPNISVRKLAQELGISRSTVHRILKQHKYHPFKMHLVQGLLPNDFERRLRFIAVLQIMINDNPALLNHICWRDESKFHSNGVVNRHNAHYWSQDNPHWMQETKFQTVWSVNVWCGLFNGYLIGPYFYEGTLTGQKYLEFLQNILPGLLENIPLQERAAMVWQQDGAPAHNTRIVTKYLNNAFPRGWIGNKSNIQWPARSPDLTPLDFFLWGYLKDIVYQRRPENVDGLKNRIREACQSVTPAMILAACTREIIRRYEVCVAAGGAHFEHL